MKAIRPNFSGIFPQLESKNGIGYAGDIALGNGTQFAFRMFWNGSYLVAGILGYGCYEFEGFVHWNYAKGKLLLPTVSEAKHVADFLNDQHSWAWGGKRFEKRQGLYQKEFTTNEADVLPNGEPAD